MKINATKLLYFLVFTIMLFPGKNTQAQTDYSIPCTVSITSTGINRFIASQWSSIPTSWSGSYQGISYSFSLSKPTISLTTNSIKVILGLTVNSSVYSGQVIVTPSLTIPSTTVNASDIISKYLDLHQQIITTTQLIDPRLQYVIEQALVPIDWIVYKGKYLKIRLHV